MFQLCRNMKWSYLPVAGGLYDQDPDLLDKFEYIFRKIAQQEAAEREKQDRESRKQQAASKSRSMGKRGRR